MEIFIRTTRQKKGEENNKKWANNKPPTHRHTRVEGIFLALIDENEYHNNKIAVCLSGEKWTCVHAHHTFSLYLSLSFSLGAHQKVHGKKDFSSGKINDGDGVTVDELSGMLDNGSKPRKEKMKIVQISRIKLFIVGLSRFVSLFFRFSVVQFRRCVWASEVITCAELI